jgi:hypothetical protein
MSAGLGTDLNSFNRMIGQAVLNLAQALSACTSINTLLNDANRGFNAEGLAALGMAGEDITNVQEAFAALSQLQQLSVGQIAQSGAQPTNFFYQAQMLMGTNPM